MFIQIHALCIASEGDIQGEDRKREHRTLNASPLYLGNP